MEFNDYKIYINYLARRIISLIELADSIGGGSCYHDDTKQAINEYVEAQHEVQRMLIGLPQRDIKELYFTWEDHDHDENCDCLI